LLTVCTCFTTPKGFAVSEPKELSELSDEQLIELNLELGVQQDAIRAKRVDITAELNARRARLEEARALVRQLEQEGGAVVEGQVLEVKAGV
jgi:hypothetical protein